MAIVACFAVVAQVEHVLSSPSGELALFCQLEQLHRVFRVLVGLRRGVVGKLASGDRRTASLTGQT